MNVATQGPRWSDYVTIARQCPLRLPGRPHFALSAKLNWAARMMSFDQEAGREATGFSRYSGWWCCRMASRGTRATAKDLAHRIFDFGAAGCPRFRRRMTELGYVEGKNLIVDARAAVGRYDPLPDWLTLRPAPEFCLTPRGNGSGERSRGAAARVHGPILDHRGKPISGHAAGFEPTSQARVDIRRHRRSAFKSNI